MNSKDLSFTGERFVPGCGGAQILYEHAHRYLFSRPWASGARALDLACGEGYGSFLLAQAAAAVTGVDIDAETVRHAAATYTRPNLSFLRAGADRLPFAASVFDLVAAFEIIEHLDAQEAALAEIARVLRPSGLALISTPNKKVYSDARGYVNPFHVREFYVAEFDALLRRYFPHVLLLGQRVTTGSLIWAPASRAATFPPRGERPALEIIPPEAGAAAGDWTEEAMYVLALCSPTPLPPPESFCPAGLLDPQGAYLAELQAQILWSQGLADELAAKDARIVQLQKEVESLSQWGTKLDAEIKEKDQSILKLQAEVEALSHWGDRLALESDAKDATILRMQKEFAERTEWALRLDAEVHERDATILRYQKETEALTAQLTEIRRAFVYRAFRKLGALP